MRIYTRRPWTIERLAARLVPNGECLEWAGCRDSCGYGCIRLEGRCERAHRLSFLLHGGELPEAHHVLHRCDNPPCCRYEHLFAGTQPDNSKDMVAKGRAPGAKLSPSQVPLVRAALAAGIPQLDVAVSFGISQTNVSDIKLGRIWNDNGVPHVRKAHLKPDVVLAIRAANDNGKSQAEIAKAFGVTQSQVSNIVLRKQWRHV